VEGQFAIGSFSLVAVALAVIAWVALVRFRINATWLIILGGGVGIVMGLVGG